MGTGPLSTQNGQQEPDYDNTRSSLTLSLTVRLAQPIWELFSIFSPFLLGENYNEGA